MIVAPRNLHVHIGPGAFHRAHRVLRGPAASLRQALGDSALSLKSTGLRDSLGPSRPVTLVELGAAPRARVIGAIRELLVGPTDTDAAFARLTARDTRIVSLTVTEKGYCLDSKNELDSGNADIAHDLANPGNPRSTIGWLVEGLRRRRAHGVPPYAVLSCDNLPDNGSVLHRALASFARRSDADLAKWIERSRLPATWSTALAGHRRRAANTRQGVDRGNRRVAHSARAVHPMGDRRPPVMRDADWTSVGVTLRRM